MPEYSRETIREIEEKWRAAWERTGLYQVTEDRTRPKYYVLDMFPYPSGAGLHVGHPLGYIASDIVSRYKRLKGFNVLHPMGFDAFGLPAEQYAIQTGQHPAVTTQKNIATYKRQLRQIGFSFDWSREVQTSDPKFYKWTQWIFMKLFNSWYDSDGDGKTKPIEELIHIFESAGNIYVHAACDEGTASFTSAQWKAFGEKEKEEVLQKYRIAYRSETIVNWCAALGTVLSNDEVKDGVSERGGYPVERIRMWQWSMRISAYAERLLKGLDVIDWPEPLKEMQRNWIGKSIGAELSFKVMNSSLSIPVFTTRIDTIFGVTFVVVAPEHDLVPQLTTREQKKEVDAYVEVAKNRSERERMSEVKRVSGVFTGSYVTHPLTGKGVPVWIADYVLAGYGTGAVMAVPSNDTRDYAFAKHFDLEIIQILEGPTSDITAENFEPKSGTMINSDFLNGLAWNKAIEAALGEFEKRGIGKRKVNYRMRDAIFGRQRYWGEPFPVYYDEGIPRLVDEKDLPVTLPEIDEYRPTATGEPPLGRALSWGYHGLPYELTTMPGWAGSSWYWYRYMDPHNDREFCNRDIQDYWKDVDLYIGGSEHATGHLLYSRFWNKALKDLGFVDAEEPFKKLINQGHIQGVSKKIRIVGGGKEVHSRSSTIYVGDMGVVSLGDDLFYEFLSAPIDKYPHASYLSNVSVDLVKDEVLDIPKYLEALSLGLPNFANAVFICEKGYWRYRKTSKGWTGEFVGNGNRDFKTISEVEKMSKTKLNVVNPDEIVETYGADTLRMYEMFLGPIELSKPWNTNGIDGVYKFLRRFWNLFHNPKSELDISEANPTEDELRILHRTLRKISEDIERYSFNTAVSEFMICCNELAAANCNKRAILEPLTIALAPFAPHITEELWKFLGHTESVHKAKFPEYDPQYLVINSFEYPISINGKVRAKMEFALDMPKEDIEKLVLASETVIKWTEGKRPKKVIIVPGRIVNVVL